MFWLTASSVARRQRLQAWSPTLRSLTSSVCCSAQGAALQSSAPKPQAGNASADGRAGSTAYLLAIPAAVSAYLGWWQLERRSWKVDMLQRRAHNLQSEPVDVFEYMTTPPEYLRVKAQGVMLHDKTQYIGPRPRSVVGGSQIGYVIVTPLIQASTGRAVLVNRGWAPSGWTDRPTDSLDQPDHDTAASAKGLRRKATKEKAAPQVQVEGVVMLSEPRSSFVPDNVPQQGQWYWIDSVALAQAAGLPPDTPLVEVVSTDEGASQLQRGTVPTAMDILGGRGKMVQVQEHYPVTKHLDAFVHFHVMPQDHLNYALTWFSLCAATGLMAIAAVRRKQKARR